MINYDRIRLVGEDYYFNLVLDGHYIAEITRCEEGYKIDMHYDGAYGIFEDRDDAIEAAIRHTEKIWARNIKEANAVLRPGFFGSIRNFLGF